jgi:hypothetical protein
MLKRKINYFLPRLAVFISFVLAAVWLLSIGISSAAQWEIENPYANVDWDNCTRYKANFHTHTVYSDGELLPHEAIDAYNDLGYDILALTDHDSDHYAARPKILYPWQELNNIFNEIKDKPNPSWKREGMNYGDFSEPWQDRDPSKLKMISVAGVEISRTHHLGSLFNDYAGNTPSETVALEEIGNHGGLAILFHPGRYNFPVEWYVDMYKTYPHLIGLEVYNQGDRYPNDRKKWDEILTEIIDERPIWGFSDDDMHTLEHLGRNWNIMLLPELSAEWVRRGMEEGMFFFVYAPAGHKGPLPPKVESITVDSQKGTISINLTGHNKIIWISEGKEVHQGDSINLNEIPELGKYVRAEVHYSGGIINTQPFIVRQKKE